VRRPATVLHLMGFSDAPKLLSSVQLFARLAAKSASAAASAGAAPCNTVPLSVAELAALAEACQAVLGVCKDQEPAWKQRPFY
jgi:hypothetical protein